MTAARHHHDLHGDALIASARQVLESSGEQWTAMRADLFNALAVETRPVSAYDLAERIGAQRGKRVAANSVYRILDLFVKTNLARRLESENAFVINAHPACAHDCIYLICDRCGAAQHLDADDAASAIMAVARNTGFAPERPVIEVRGRCAACADGREPSVARDAGVHRESA